MPDPDECGQQPSWGKAPPIPMLLQGQPRIWSSYRLMVIALAAGTVFSSFYAVQPTEMADMRRLGTVLTAEPVGPGLHTKLPWMNVADMIQVSLDAFQLNNLTVHTIGNQPVTVGIGVSYRIPREAVLKPLHSVGLIGNIDIAENIRPVPADRVLRVFSLRNTVNISANREQVATAIRKAAIRAENTVSEARFEGEQAKVQAEAQASARVARAKGEFEAAIAQAHGQREAAILRAQGESQAALLVGDASARVIQQAGAAVAANPGVVAYGQAHHWNGRMPATALDSGTGPLAMLSIPGASGALAAR